MSRLIKRQWTYNFYTEWENLYCFINLKDKCVCLLCRKNILMSKKKHNVKFHFLKIHATFSMNYAFKSEIKKKKID